MYQPMGLSEKVRIRCVCGADADCLGEVVPTQWECSIVEYICKYIRVGTNDACYVYGDASTRAGETARG